jgi:protein-disulfide isomerase
MPNARSLMVTVPLVLVLFACGPSSAQSPRSVEELQKELEAVRAEQQEMRKSLEEVRDFLRAATGGRFGAPSLVNMRFETAGAPAFGDVSAPVTIVEISDYHCPFCRRHVQQTQPRIYSEYVQPGRARHVFIHYPIAQLHPDAHRAHEAASCAADQGKFWEYHARMFDTPVRTVEELTELARATGLDVGAFRTCLDSGRHTDAVRASVSRIQELHISGTPMFLIGRTEADGDAVTVQRVVEGAQPFEAFKAALDEVAATRVEQ